jgi:hypothetical protein
LLKINVGNKFSFKFDKSQQKLQVHMMRTVVGEIKGAR